MTKQIRKIFYGKVASNKLELENKEGFKFWLLGLEGREVELTGGEKQLRHYDARSLQQNKYYWGVMIPILGNYFGMTHNETHEALKWHFLRKEDKKIPTIRSTTDLSTVEFEEYMKQVRVWASEEFGTYIPQPNEPYEY